MGLLRLWETFAGDQAMFVVYAAEINRGATLYRDIWDLKQPGIFLFYLTGGKLFGFTEFGIHLFELVYWLIFSIILSVSLKDYFRHVYFAALTPLLTVGVYYAVCGSWHLTQVEGLVGFPLFLTLLAAVKAARTQSARAKLALLFLSGLAGGVVLVFKLILLPVVAAFWLVILIVFAVGRSDSLAKVLSLSVLPILFGLSVPLIAVVLYFIRNDALALMDYTFFEYPVQAVSAFAGENRVPILKQGVSWFVRAFLPLFILILFWCLIAVKNFKVRHKGFAGGLKSRLQRLDLLTVGLFLWLFAGFGVVLAQRLSWWEYHYLLLFVPLGILTTKSLEAIREQAIRMNLFFAKTAGQAVFTLFVFIIFIPILKPAVRRIKNTITDAANLPTGEFWMARGDMDEQYRQIRHETAFLDRRNDSSDKIFVCGQPLYYYLSGRSPAISSNGWMPELFLPEQWKQLDAELAAHSPAYILVDRECRRIMAEKSPETQQLIENKYRLRSEAATKAIWYERIAAP